jgi:hypothetical protein
MSFTANRIYNIVQGVNYDPTVNGNVAIKFAATITAGSPIITVTRFPDSNPVARVLQILAFAPLQVPVIIGPGFAGREIVVAASGNTITLTNNSANTGTFEFYVFDGSRPSSIDAPITAFHVVAAPGLINFATLTGDLVSIPAGGVVAGGIYEYGIRSFTTLTNANSLLGLAPISKSLTL